MKYYNLLFRCFLSQADTSKTVVRYNTYQVAVRCTVLYCLHCVAV